MLNDAMDGTSSSGRISRVSAESGSKNNVGLHIPCLRVARRLCHDDVVPSRTDEPDERAKGINKKLIRSRTMI